MGIKKIPKIYFIATIGLLFGSLFFTTKSANASCNYTDNAFQVSGDIGSSISPIYRLYNKQTGAYLYARSTTDANYVLGKWADFEYTDPVPAFCASLTASTNLTPIYRLYNTLNGAYLYTRGDADKAHVMNTWPEFEFTDGIPAFYASLTEQDGLTPIYRLYNTLNGMYLYTRGDADKAHVMNTWPEFEFTDGIPAFYAHLTNDSGPNLIPYQGPEIRVGIWSYVRDDIRSTTGEPFKIDANKNYVIKNGDGTIIATMTSAQQARVAYEGSGSLQIYSSDAGIPITSIGDRVIFEAADGINNDMIFDAHRPSIPTAEYDDYNHYRGKIELRYTDSSKNDNIYDDGVTKRIWVINELPLEQYTWGMAELNLANVTEHNRVMVTIFRTYGKSKTEVITDYDQLGFDLLSTPASQKYNGYDYEISRPTIKDAALATRGKIVTYQGETALTAYSSWSDGNTRALDLDIYPYLRPVSDPYGNYNGEYWNNSYMSTEALIARGNHMKGLIAQGSVTLAYDLGWDWERILNYYYTGIDITSSY